MSVLVHMVLERLGISEDIVLTNRAAVDLVYMVLQRCSRSPFELTYATVHTRMLRRHMRLQAIITFEGLSAIVTRKFSLFPRQWGFEMNGLQTCGTNGDDSRTEVTMGRKCNIAREWCFACATLKLVLRHKVIVPIEQRREALVALGAWKLVGGPDMIFQVGVGIKGPATLVATESNGSPVSRWSCWRGRRPGLGAWKRCGRGMSIGCVSLE